jgi:hypothetical protein
VPPVVKRSARPERLPAADFVGPRLVGLGLLVTGVAIAAWPGWAVAVAIAVTVASLAFVVPRPVGVAIVGAAVVAVFVSIWPAFTIGVALVLVVSGLARLAPPVALVVAIATFGVEGELKAQLWAGLSPITADQLAVGAVVLDIALLVGFITLAASQRDRLSALWRKPPGLARIGYALLAVWLAASLIQISESGDLTAGLEGFRLTQSYVLLIVAGALVVLAGAEAALVSLLLPLLLAVGGYAALRTATGPTGVERAFALSRAGTKVYGGVFRTVGSFSGAVGLASFLVPAAVFAFALAILVPRRRIVGGLVFACSLAAIVGSYSRGALVAVAAALVVVVALAFTTASLAAHQKARVAAVVAAVLVVATVGTAAASHASPVIERRTRAFVEPLQDTSLKIRFSAWRDSLHEIADHPFGTGVGTVGRASARNGSAAETTDNSYLKVAREQGIAIALVFVAGVVALLASAIRGLRQASGEMRALGIAAISGFAAFLVLAGSGEYVEQPGKVLAWTFLGCAVGISTRSIRSSS